MPLSAFPPEVLTFTFPDSMASLPLATHDRHLPERKPYHGKVFTLDRIRQVIEDHGLPGNQWQSDRLCHDLPLPEGCRSPASES
jgi:hypothetical protein